MKKDMNALILIVDDNQDCRDIYSRYVRYVGMDAETAVSGREAIQTAIRILPDLIVMDLTMPTLNGWRALRRLKGDRRTRGIPVIALTGQAANAPEETAALSAGFARFCRKPCLPASLVTAIRDALADNVNPERRSGDLSGQRSP